jgi:hypothetical protein
MPERWASYTACLSCDSVNRCEPLRLRTTAVENFGLSPNNKPEFIHDCVGEYAVRVVSKFTKGLGAKKPREKLTGKAGKPLAKTVATEKRIHQVFVRSLLTQENLAETRDWLQGSGNAARSLGRFKRESDALKFIEVLYKAGATKVIAPDIHSGKSGGQFADCLLVKLPKIAPKRKAVRKVCSQLSKRKLGVFQPDKDIGETHLYLSLA